MAPAFNCLDVAPAPVHILDMVPMQTWADSQAELARVASRQLFFIGGAPRSGTTWLQQMLDAHPDVSCRGEGLFQQHLAGPLDTLMAGRRRALEAKNTGTFRHTGGYPLPEPDDTETLLGTAILLALHRQSAGRACQAIGEKTPENVFFFPRLLRLFPEAKLIAIARDPRDVLTSAWHFFHKPAPDEDETAAKFDFIHLAIPSVNQGARTMIALRQNHPDHVRLVTYEALRQKPEPVLADLFRFLGVPDRDEIVADCLARTVFAVQTGGRTPGAPEDGSFLRSGTVGGWRSTLTQDMGALIVRELGWMFPAFHWRV